VDRKKLKTKECQDMHMVERSERSEVRWGTASTAGAGRTGRTQSPQRGQARRLYSGRGSSRWHATTLISARRISVEYEAAGVYGR